MELSERTLDEAQKQDLKTLRLKETQNTLHARHNILNYLMLEQRNLETIEALIKIIKLSSE